LSSLFLLWPVIDYNNGVNKVKYAAVLIIYTLVYAGNSSTVKLSVFYLILYLTNILRFVKGFLLCGRYLFVNISNIYFNFNMLELCTNIRRISLIFPMCV